MLPFITLYLTSRGYSVPQAGLGLAGYGLGAIGAQAVGGLLADRIGRRNTIVARRCWAERRSRCRWCGSTGCGPSSLVVLLLGFFGELYRPASSALVADLVAPEARVAAFSVYRMMINIGFACGLALGGILAGESYHLLFVGDAVTSTLFALIAIDGAPARHADDQARGARARSHERRPLDPRGQGVPARDGRGVRDRGGLHAERDARSRCT